MTVDDATDVLDPSRADASRADVSRPGDRDVPPFPVYDAPGTPEAVSDVSSVHREVTYARAIGFRPLKMDIWLPRRGIRPDAAGAVGARRRLPAGGPA